MSYVEYQIPAGTIMVTAEDAALLDGDMRHFGKQVIQIPQQATNGVKFGRRLHPALYYTDGRVS
jgi:hypothetical protein